MVTTPVSLGVQIRDADDGPLAVNAITASSDVELLLATPVGQRDERIPKDQLAAFIGAVGFTNTIAPIPSTGYSTGFVGFFVDPADANAFTLWELVSANNWEQRSIS